MKKSRELLLAGQGTRQPGLFVESGVVGLLTHHLLWLVQQPPCPYLFQPAVDVLASGLPVGAVEFSFFDAAPPILKIQYVGPRGKVFLDSAVEAVVVIFSDRAPGRRFLVLPLSSLLLE